ncbi:MAG: hypothetical protein WAR77_12195 [Saprospiraceae bacterium]|nr:hypothetical protein [Saprospiraceae bacterium]MBK8449918.1 hypothetical protein [Saprospiraceae bacterium]MBK8484023.1 hypothetical protein [Saprospiraceae bacterium]MBK9728698.1 hypothetical protein [Saprospiraceae bacterium]
MKNLFLLFAFTLCVGFLNAQTTPTDTKKPSSTTTQTPTSTKTVDAAKPGDATEMTDSQLKEHKCTKACRTGKHSYAHGEKGHTCTEACRRPKTDAKPKTTTRTDGRAKVPAPTPQK